MLWDASLILQGSSTSKIKVPYSALMTLRLLLYRPSYLLVYRSVNSTQSSFVHHQSTKLCRIMSRWQSMERTTEKTRRELEIRDHLRRWDNENPELRHEMIVKTLASGLFSLFVTNLYLSFCRRIRGYNNRGRY